MRTPVGDRVQKLLEMSGMSAASLGLAVGLSHGTISMIVTGERRCPSSTTLSKLARGLGVSVAWLIDGSGPKPDSKRVRAAAVKATKARAAAASPDESRG